MPALQLAPDFCRNYRTAESVCLVPIATECIAQSVRRAPLPQRKSRCTTPVYEALGEPKPELRSLTEMGRQITVVLYVVAMVAVIVGVDFLFFRHRFWERLIVNIGIVLVFAAFYLRFVGRP